MSVSGMGGNLVDYPPALPSIEQVKASLKQRFCEERAPVVHDILSPSILQWKYPKDYEHALMSSVSKVWNPVDVKDDFRQISVLPQIAKILEKFRFNFNEIDLKRNNTQYAFTPGKSTVEALANFT